MKKSSNYSAVFIHLRSIYWAGLSFAATLLAGARTVFGSIGSLQSQHKQGLIALCTASLLCTPVGAQDNPKELPLPSSNPAAEVTISTEKTNEIAQRVASLFAAAQAEQASPVFSERQRSVLRKLETRAASPVEFRHHPLTGTVRQIKGSILQRAEGSKEATARSFLRVNRELLKIDAPDDEFLLSSSQADELGRHHLRFDQQYRGLPVWPARTIVHLDPSGNVDLMGGVYVPTPSDSGNATTPVIDKDKAVALARTVAPDGDSGTLTKVDLIFYATDEGVAKLGWKIELSMASHSNWLVVIDALNGETLVAYNQVMNAGVSGAGIDSLNISRSLQVYQDGSTYYMINTGKSMYDKTSTILKGVIRVGDANHTPSDLKNGIPTLSDVTSTTANSGWLPDAVSLAYNLSETYDYYKVRHGRNSIDNKGGNIVGIVRYGANYPNAFWSPSEKRMSFGDGMATIDTVAHEMTHGVTNYTADFNYVNQSGALHEAFSDIFGEAVEARTRGAADWVHGTDESPSRSLKDPHAFTFGCKTKRTYPAKMSEFLTPTDPILTCYENKDHGGLHFNHTIISHAFYLLAAGTAGAIGMTDAERIFYRALTIHLIPMSQFIDARLAAIASAEELFGKGSAQAIKTAQAFDAVEIYDNAPTPAPAPIPTVAGADSTMFIFKDSNGWQLGRRETALGDDAGGNYMTNNKLAAVEKVSVSGDGSLMAFVSSDNDLCLINTDSTNFSCLGMPNRFKSVALSPSAKTVALVLRDSGGLPTNEINLLDVSSGAYQAIGLKAAAIDSQALNTIYFADTMAFDFNKSRLFYDAVTKIPLADGTTSTVYSLYALDIASGATLSVIPPIAGLNVSNPALGHVHNDLLVFEAYDATTRNSQIYVSNLTTGKLQPVGTTGAGYGFPSFTGDDSAIVYTRYDQTVPSETSLWKQPLAADHMTPSGTATVWLTDGAVPTIYRRGNYTSGTTVVEFYHSGLNNYFITADPGEQGMVDSGAMGAWKRTGYTFKAGGTTPVCRFYGNSYGPNSHFYTADEDECANLVATFNPIAKSWKLESYDFATTLPTNKQCPSSLVPVYRAYNNGFARGADSNHRITSNYSAYQQTVAAGWSGEGVIMCAPK